MQGNTIRGLEYRWQASQGVLTALSRFRYAPWISITTLLTTLYVRLMSHVKIPATIPCFPGKLKTAQANLMQLLTLAR